MDNNYKIERFKPQGKNYKPHTPQRPETEEEYQKRLDIEKLKRTFTPWEKEKHTTTS